MEEDNNWLKKEIAQGFTMLAALNLKGRPAAADLKPVAILWLKILSRRQWQFERDAPRVRSAFEKLAAESNEWPNPADFTRALPPELLRKGRFDELFFVDLPEAPDREEIIGLYFRKYLGAEPSQELLTDLVTLTDGFSGSDIDAVIHDIATKVYVDRMPGLPPEPEIKKFFTNVVPFSQTNPEDLAAIRSWGSTRCVPAARHVASNVPAAPAGRRVVIL